MLRRDPDYLPGVNSKIMIMKIKLAQILQQYANDQETVEVEGTTLRECLNDLAKRYPETKKWIFDVNNSPLILVLLNKEIVLPKHMDDKLTGNEKIDLIPMIAGG
jgi:molybdopterin converting factor small subunit